jgi:hypothetical protein
LASFFKYYVPGTVCTKLYYLKQVPVWYTLLNVLTLDTVPY